MFENLMANKGAQLRQAAQNVPTNLVVKNMSTMLMSLGMKRGVCTVYEF